MSDNVKALISLDLSEKNSLIKSLLQIEFFKRHYNAKVINYDEAQKDQYKEFSKAIEAFDGFVDKDLLEMVLKLQDKKRQMKMKSERRSTHINEKASKAESVLFPEIIEFYNRTMNQLVEDYKDV